VPQKPEGVSNGRGTCWGVSISRPKKKKGNNWGGVARWRRNRWGVGEKEPSHKEDGKVRKKKVLCRGKQGGGGKGKTSPRGTGR